jgi:folylpolyglutamate synthase
LAAAADDRVGVPAYFKFLTLVGLRCFLDAGVDVAILEVGIGGRLDATNACPPPVAAGVASLGFDHMDLLGDTLPAIATQKAGIFKPGSRAFTVPQRPDAMETLVVRFVFLLLVFFAGGEEVVRFFLTHPTPPSLPKN